MEQIDQPLNERESLQIIEAMIKTAKKRIHNNGFDFMLWGWLVFISAIICYLIITIYGRPDYAGLPWAFLMPLGAIVSIIHNIRRAKREKVKTYIGQFLKYVFIAFGVTLAIIGCFAGILKLSTYPLIMLTYGGTLFICGGALKFSPLLIGGIINWIIAIVSFFLTFEQQLLAISVAVLMGYIIPGHIMQYKFKNEAV